MKVSKIILFLFLIWIISYIFSWILIFPISIVNSNLVAKKIISNVNATILINFIIT